MGQTEKMERLRKKKPMQGFPEEEQAIILQHGLEIIDHGPYLAHRKREHAQSERRAESET